MCARIRPIVASRVQETIHIHSYPLISDDVLAHKLVGTQVICDRESANVEVEAVLNSQLKLSSAITFPFLSTDEQSKVISEKPSSSSCDGEEPFFILPLEDGFLRGNSCTFKCIVMSTPAAEVKWSVDGTMVTDDE